MSSASRRAPRVSTVPSSVTSPFWTLTLIRGVEVGMFGQAVVQVLLDPVVGARVAARAVAAIVHPWLAADAGALRHPVAAFAAPAAVVVRSRPPLVSGRHGTPLLQAGAGF